MPIQDTFIRRYECDAPGCIATGTYQSDSPSREGDAFRLISVETGGAEYTTVLCAAHAGVFIVEHLPPFGFKEHRRGAGPR